MQRTSTTLALTLLASLLACGSPAGTTRSGDAPSPTRPDTARTPAPAPAENETRPSATDADTAAAPAALDIEARRAQLRAAEDALARHRDAIAGQPGVILVGIGDHSDGSGRIAVLILLAGPTAASQLRLPDMDALVDVQVRGDDPPAHGQCTHEGRTYQNGERVPVDCNTCVCNYGQLSRCTLLGCEVQILEKVYFAHKNARIPEPAHAILDAIVAVFAQFPKLRVTIEGHAATNEGRRQRRQSLSRARAEAVRDYLLSHGAAAVHITDTVGHGAQRPRAENHEQNRRVGFSVDAH